MPCGMNHFQLKITVKNTVESYRSNQMLYHVSWLNLRHNALRISSPRILDANQLIFGKIGPLLFPYRTHIWHMHDLILAFRFSDTNSITIFMRKERIQTRKRGKCFFQTTLLFPIRKVWSSTSFVFDVVL